MPLNEFWHGDVRLLGAYQKAYLRDRSYTAWINGAHFFEGANKAVANGNRTKKSDPVLQYDDWKDPIEKVNKKPKITKNNLEQEFRNMQARQSAWLHNILHANK